MYTLDIQQTDSLDNHKLNIIQWIETLDDFAIIKQLEEFKTRVSTNTINTINATSTTNAINTKNSDKEAIGKAEQQSVLKGIEDAKNGQLNPHSEAYKIYGKWLGA